VGQQREEKKSMPAHLYGAAPGHNLAVFHRPLDNHDGVMQTPFYLFDKLFCTSPENEGTSFGFRAIFKQVVPFSANLLLLEGAARSKMLACYIRTRRLDGAAGGLNNSAQIAPSDPTRAEDIAISKPLCCQIADGEFTENNLCARLFDSLQFSVDYFPFRVDDSLIVGHCVYPNLGVILLRFELELDVQTHDEGIAERFWLLLGTSVGEGLFEGYTLDEEGILHASTGDFLDTDQRLVQFSLV
jgi:hypothetical protein